MSLIFVFIISAFEEGGEGIRAVCCVCHPKNKSEVVFHCTTLFAREQFQIRFHPYILCCGKQTENNHSTATPPPLAES